MLVLDGAAPLLTAEHLATLVAEHARAGAAVTILSSSPTGRCRTAASSAAPTARSSAIVEDRDATAEQLAIRELNSSIYVFAREPLWEALGSSTRTTRRASST